MGFSLKSFVAAMLLAGVAALAQAPAYNVGRTPTPEELRAWDISVGPAGKELPPGSGTAKDGAALYVKKCAACHGQNLEGGKAGPRLMGGQGTLTTEHAQRSIGSYWPFASTIWDFISRAMPKGQEATLKPDEVYALTAYLLYKNDIIKDTDIIDTKTLPKVQMPNRANFIPLWPDWKKGENRPFGIYP